MKKSLLYLLCSIAALTISACSHSNKVEDHSIDENFIDENGNLTEPIDIATNFDNEKPHDEYQEGVVLVKTFEDIDISTLDLKVASIEELYPHSPWKKITLNSGTSYDAVQYLRNTNLFDKVDYDYIMKGEEVEIEAIDVSSNDFADDLPYIESSGIAKAWGWANYRHNHGEEVIAAGGSSDVVIAVIDTGVDYNHIDLRNNIWTNVGEIPNNGVDDDGNGYVDDVRGWDCVNEDNDPMDDNGHGTHVAGIAAAENNLIGTVGVAFNCKIMPIKAGNSSGSFTNADIAQAVQYAYMNGASVINMSFGGTSISLVAEEALSAAYNQCVLVAAAGNDGMCSEPGCPSCQPNCAPFYPASLPYIVGVMSCNSDGSFVSSFSNYDHKPYHYNQYEYDCYACGEQIISTWPGNKYARLSGTSMASPVVAGIAALLRSAYPDRDTFSNKYIHSQLTNTGLTNTVIRFGNSLMNDDYHPLCDAYEALTNIPTPHIYNLYNYYAFDSEEFSPNNNGDGFIDAGETIRLGIELQNRGGKAKNVTATIDTIRNGDPNLTDPNVDIVIDTIHMDDIGTYSIQDGGKIYEDDKVVNMTNAFVIEINPDTQNGYECEFNLNLEYYNGLTNDQIKYTSNCKFTITINSGYHISGIINEDTVFEADKSYLVTSVVTIPADVTVTFEPGCLIEFYGTNASYINELYDTPSFEVYGTLNIVGSAEHMITMRPTSNYYDYSYFINSLTDDACVNILFANIVNMCTNCEDKQTISKINNLSNSTYKVDKTNHGYYPGWKYLFRGMDTNNQSCEMKLINVDNCMFDFRLGCDNSVSIRGSMKNSIVLMGQMNCGFSFSYNNYSSLAQNNLFVATRTTNTDYSGRSNSWISFNCYFDCYTTLINNSFIQSFVPSQIQEMTNISLYNNFSSASYQIQSEGNVFSKTYRDYANNLFSNLIDSNGQLRINLNDVDNHDDSVIWPYIKDISILNSNNDVVHTVGTEKNKVRVTFSRDMDTSNDFSLFYGSWYPYSDYQIHGDYISDTVWEGEIQVKAAIEGGIQYFSSKGGCAKDDSFKTLVDNAGAFTFNIDTSSAFAMNLQANTSEEGIELTWVQDDYDTLMGYNIYRSESKDGNFIKINPSVISAGENTFLDDSCEPGQTYWYTFTVVLSDFSESAPAGKVSATAIDTISPNIYHTPVNQGYENNNLVINCTISDNIAVKSATLYYRTVGDEEWKTLVMSKVNDRFSATIFGSDVTLTGLEYYISATDGRNVITRGSADNPFTVVVKDASLLNNLGDVDGDGTITTKDALMIMQAINGDLLLTDDQFQRADLNKDRVLSSVEALRILQYINGKVSTLEM